MITDLSFPTERFQQSHTAVTSEDTEVGRVSTSPSREINQTKGYPDLDADQKPKRVRFEKAKKKKKLVKDAGKEKTATAARQPHVEIRETNKNAQSSLTPGI